MNKIPDEVTSIMIDDYTESELDQIRKAGEEIILTHTSPNGVETHVPYVDLPITEKWTKMDEITLTEMIQRKKNVHDAGRKELRKITENFTLEDDDLPGGYIVDNAHRIIHLDDELIANADLIIKALKPFSKV